MATFRNCIIEYDGTGTPTGNIWIDGEKHTVPAASLPRYLPETSNTASTSRRFKIAFEAYCNTISEGTAASGSTASLTLVDKNGRKLSAVTATHA